MNDFFIRIQNTGITRNISIVLAELAIDTILVVQGIQFVSDDEFFPKVSSALCYMSGWQTF